MQHDAAGELPDGVEHVAYPVVSGVRRAAAGLRLRAVPGGLVHGLDVDLPLHHDAPRVATIHDLSVFDVPWAHGRLRARAERQLIGLALRRADVVLAVSAFTADRVWARFGRDSVVTPLAPGRAMRPAAADDVERVRREHGLDERTVVCVGTVEPRKRVDLLAAACEQAGLPLALAGKVDGDAVPAGARHLGYVPGDDLPALYAAAGAVAYASCYEGFGLPPVEAMACGGAVVATRVGGLPEAVGDGAVLVAPDDVDALAGALRDVVLDREANAALREAGVAAAAALSWTDTARTTLDAYRSLGVRC
ncbi:hypothetical protein GCM10023340_04390 [Nocardioides marinquilinus]|uniref:Uncharacterized protein n=1 Tax=Nocardioides marinquilinus TaxID=1210400 RepID=A0ABP9P749_9ACTN